MANALGQQVIILETPTDRDYEAAFSRIVQDQVGALVVGAFAFPTTLAARPVYLR